MMGADDVQIIPIAQRHTESFHTVFDTIARERRYLTYLEAPPLPATRDYIARVIENNWPFNLARSGRRSRWLVQYRPQVAAHLGPLRGSRHGTPAPNARPWNRQATH